ncbi:MAG: ribosome biogenesis GTPase Der [Rickettsiales bacterium]
MFTIAVVGKPNVGKSTLFNKLSLGKKSIVHDEPGVTRDITITKASLSDLEFDLMDSAGLFDNPSSVLNKKIYANTLVSLQKSDLLLFVIDGQTGVTEHDYSLAKVIRKVNKPILLVVNKCDSKAYKKNIHEFEKLGFKEQVYISAEHKSGFIDLYEAIKLYIPEDQLSPNGDAEAKIKLAVIGKPNTGKSTFVNKVIKEERLITGPEAGVTRDSVNISWRYKEHTFEIIDTAGLRKSGKIKKDTIEQYSISQTISAVNTSNIVILLNDVNEPLFKQDLKIANLALKEGKPIIIGFNKADLFKNLEEMKPKLNKYALEVITNIQDLPIFYFSAQNDKSFNKIFDAAIDLYELWNHKISKRDLNAWLEYATEQHPPPLAKNSRRIKLKYIVQAAIRPPTFKIFANIAEDIPRSYIKYLSNSLQKSFGLEQIPTRIIVQKNYNPYQST